MEGLKAAAIWSRQAAAWCSLGPGDVCDALGVSCNIRSNSLKFAQNRFQSLPAGLDRVNSGECRRRTQTKLQSTVADELHRFDAAVFCDTLLASLPASFPVSSPSSTSLIKDIDNVWMLIKKIEKQNRSLDAASDWLLKNLGVKSVQEDVPITTNRVSQ